MERSHIKSCKVASKTPRGLTRTQAEEKVGSWQLWSSLIIYEEFIDVSTFMSARKRRDQSIAGRGGSRGWRDDL